MDPIPDPSVLAFVHPVAVASKNATTATTANFPDFMPRSAFEMEGTNLNRILLKTRSRFEQPALLRQHEQWGSGISNFVEIHEIIEWWGTGCSRSPNASSADSKISNSAA
jgi:hypothetical protein